jgi:hypothetical protein
MVEPAGENVGVDRPRLVLRLLRLNNLAGDGWVRFAERAGCGGAIQYHDAQVGPKAEGEIDGEDGHV